MEENRRIKLKENRSMKMRETLMLKRISICDIRDDAMPLGLLDHKISLLDGFNVERNVTKLRYQPGTLISLELHDCGTSRATGYFLEPLTVLGLFGKDTFTITLKGITNDRKDPFVGTFRATTLPLLKFSVPPERVDLKIESQGIPPLGGGEVVLSISPVVHDILKAITWIDDDIVKIIRGFTFSSGVSGQFEDKMLQATHKIFGPLLPNVHIYTDNKQGEQAGKSPCHGVSLVATATIGCCYFADTAVTRGNADGVDGLDGETEDSSLTVNDVGGKNVRALLYEIKQAGVVDSTHQGQLFLLCALCARDESNVLLGKLLWSHGKVPMEIEEYGGFMFNTRADPNPSKKRVILKCLGNGLKNLYEKASLPDELLREIMLRMDVKTVLKCTSLSKGNYAMIRDPSFVEDFSKHSKEHLLGRLVTCSNLPGTRVSKEGICFGDRKRTKYFLYIDESLEESEMASQLQIPDHPKIWELVGILDGIMCLRNSNHVVLLNPATRQFKEMPRIANNRDYDVFRGRCIGFGLSRIGDHKVVLFGRYFRKDEYIAYVCSTTTNDSWKVIALNLSAYKFLPHGYEHRKYVTEYRKSVGIYLKGVCYWILSTGKDVDPLAIGAFDMRSDEFCVDKIAGTSCLMRDGVSPHTLSLCGDSLALLIHNYETNEIEIWMMDEQQRWSYQRNIGPFPCIDDVLFFWKPGKLLMRMKIEEETARYAIESLSQAHEFDVTSGVMKMLENPYTFTNRLMYIDPARRKRAAFLNVKHDADDINIAGVSFYIYKESLVPIHGCDQVTWDASSTLFKNFFGYDESDEDTSEEDWDDESDEDT